ncbi:uncharacterized protein VB005_06708 [Metarhizium brunneum]
MSIQGHIKTTDYNGESLVLLFLLDKQEDVDEICADLDNQVEVLRGFATAWNRGVKDINGRDPLPESKPCNTLIVIKQQHWSSITPKERVHITVKPASADWWTSEPPCSKGTVHVYSVSDDTADGFESYKIQSSSKSKFGTGTWLTAVGNAMANQYTQKSSSKSQGSNSKSHQGSSRSKSHQGSSSSKSHQGSSSKSHQSNSGNSEKQPAGYFENGAPYYYSQSQQAYYYIGSDGKRHSC